MEIKPQLAENFEEEKLRFPLLAQVKIDGCRGLNLKGPLTGRSLKEYKNKYTTQRFSGEQYKGFDGELSVGASITSQSLCRDTTSALNRITGAPVIVWNVFDYLTPESVNEPYATRLNMLACRVADLNDPLVRVVQGSVVSNLEELLEFEKKCLDEGYEGVILRDLAVPHKNGRSSPRHAGLLRIKRFSDAEARVTGIVEAKENQNEAKTNELGRSERSSHQENKVPKGMIGSLLCDDLKTGEPITVGPGEMPHDMRVHLFLHPDEIIGKVITYKTFNHAKKDKPRFPTFKNIRSEEDMSE